MELTINLNEIIAYFHATEIEKIINNNYFVPEGIISTPMPIKWRTRSRSASFGANSRDQYDRSDNTDLLDHPLSQDIEDNISDESLSKWPPSGQQTNSLRQGLYTSFNKDIFQEKSDRINDNMLSVDRSEMIWSSMEYPPSPKDAFRETCEFYGDPVFTKKNRHSLNYQMNGAPVNGGVTKMYRAKPKMLDFYKSDPKLSECHFTESSGEEMEQYVIGRSKSLHDLQHSRPSSSQPRQQTEQIGLSEHDLNRARSVLGK